MRLDWEGHRKGGHGTAVGPEVNSENFKKLDDDAESVAVRSWSWKEQGKPRDADLAQFDRGCDVGRFSVETE